MLREIGLRTLSRVTLQAVVRNVFAEDPIFHFLHSENLDGGVRIAEELIYE